MYVTPVTFFSCAERLDTLPALKIGQCFQPLKRSFPELSPHNLSCVHFLGCHQQKHQQGDRWWRWVLGGLDCRAELYISLKKDK